MKSDKTPLWDRQMVADARDNTWGPAAAAYRRVGVAIFHIFRIFRVFRSPAHVSTLSSGRASRFGVALHIPEDQYAAEDSR